MSIIRVSNANVIQWGTSGTGTFTITDNGQYVTVAETAGQTIDFDKQSMSLSANNDGLVILADDTQFFEFSYSAASYASVAVALATLDAMKQNMPAPPTPTGTQDVNIVKVGGNSVTTTVPVSINTGLPAGTNNIGDVDIASYPSGTETPTASTVTTSGTVAAGKLSVTFTTSSGFIGTILGEARAASTVYSFSISNPGKTLGAIAYTVTAGSMVIDVTV